MKSKAKQGESRDNEDNRVNVRRRRSNTKSKEEINEFGTCEDISENDYETEVYCNTGRKLIKGQDRLKQERE